MDPDSYAKRCGAVGPRVGGERSSLGGVKDHERSEYRLSLERQEFVVRNGALAEWRMTISERK